MLNSLTLEGVPNPSRVGKKKQFCMVGNFEGWVGNEEVLEFNPRRLWDLFLELVGKQIIF